MQRTLKDNRATYKVPPKSKSINYVTNWLKCIIVQSIYENYWHNLKQIATEFFSAGMHSGEVTAPNHPLFERQDRCSIFSVLCYFRYFVRE